MSQKVILIVGEDAQRCRAQADPLRGMGYLVICAKSITLARQLTEKQPINLLAIDIKILHRNGALLCREIHEHENFHDIPVIVFSGPGSNERKGSGRASDIRYLSGPVDPGDFADWVNSILREPRPQNTSLNYVEDSGLRIDLDTRILHYKNYTITSLTTREIDLLTALIRVKPFPLTRAQIISTIWKTIAVENLVDTHLFNLRKKLPKELADRIQSLPGKGFRYLTP